MTLGERIRRIRTQREFTLEKLAQGTGLTISFLSQVERDIVSPSVESLQKMIDQLKQGNVSKEDLEKIMQELKSAGLIAATHGRGGGYSLDRTPSRISVREVIEALEGPVALVTCLDPSLKCLIEDGCPTSGFWMLINERFEEALGATTLADLPGSARTPPYAKRKVPEESGSSQ